jgi:hypothetical protein
MCERVKNLVELVLFFLAKDSKGRQRKQGVTTWGVCICVRGWRMFMNFFLDESKPRTSGYFMRGMLYYVRDWRIWLNHSSLQKLQTPYMKGTIKTSLEAGVTSRGVCIMLYYVRDWRIWLNLPHSSLQI